METCITIYKINSPREFTVWLRKLKQGLCINLQGGEGDKREVQKGGVIGIPMAEGRTRLSNFTITFHFYALGKEMATHSSVLSWRIPGMGEPGGLPSMGSHRVGHD